MNLRDNTLDNGIIGRLGPFGARPLGECDTVHVNVLASV